MLVSFFVIFNAFLVVSLAAPPTEHNGRTFRNALNQQGLQTILQSIEQRLRNLDEVYSSRYAPSNINTEQYIRKIEILETKLSRMESQIEAQLASISENMNSKNFKDDIAKDQIFRKIDSVYERINHKLSYVEGKLDMDVLKLQTKIEAGISKIERLDHSFSVRQADMEAEVSEAVEMMESVRNNVATIENKLMNITKNTIEITVDKQNNLMGNKIDNVTHLIINIDKKINNSFEQCYQKDFLNDFTNKDTHLTKTFKGYEDQIQSYGNKVNNMYNELWKKSTTIENTIKNSVLLMNLTRKEIQDLKKPGHKFTTHNSQNDGQLEIIVDSFTNTIQRKFAELGQKLESNFENVMLVQNLFLESCHRIQMDEAQLESKISLVLEKLLDAITNRSANTFKEMQSVEELIKLHDTNVYKTLNQNTNTVIKLSEKTSEDRKKLEKILSTIKKDIGNALETIQNEISSEDQETNQKFDGIAGILLELQEQVNDLDNRVNEDNINYNAKQILQDILLLTKSLPDKDAFAAKLNSTILQNVEDLSKLMTSIYHLLTSIDTKINKSYLDYQPGVNNQALFHENIINNATKNHANITNYGVQENGKANLSGEVAEPVDVVLEILPEKYHKNSTKNSLLSRFNYTLITDKNSLSDYEYIPVDSPTKYETNKNGIVLNYSKNKDVPEASTIKIENVKDYEYFPVDSSTKYETNKNGIVLNYSKNKDVPEASTIKNKNVKDYVYISVDSPTKYETNKNGIVLNHAKNKTDVPEASTITNEKLNNNHNGRHQINNNDNGIVINGKHFSDIPQASTVVYGTTLETENSPEYDVPDITIHNKNNKLEKNIYIKASKEENTGIIINGNNQETVTKPTIEFPGVLKENKNLLSSTIADIAVSDTTNKSVKIESVTKETTEVFDETVDDVIESLTDTPQTINSFEYTDLKNNTNDEHIRDEYDWDYEE